MRNAYKPQPPIEKIRQPEGLRLLPPQDVTKFGGCSCCPTHPEKVWILWLGSYQARLCEECFVSLEEAIKLRRNKDLKKR